MYFKTVNQIAAQFLLLAAALFIRLYQNFTTVCHIMAYPGTNLSRSFPNAMVRSVLIETNLYAIKEVTMMIKSFFSLSMN